MLGRNFRYVCVVGWLSGVFGLSESLRAGALLSCFTALRCERADPSLLPGVAGAVPHALWGWLRDCGVSLARWFEAYAEAGLG